MDLIQNPTLDEIRQVAQALSAAQALVRARQAAEAAGHEVADCMVAVSEEPASGQWRVDFIPRDFVHQRGGDLTVLVDAAKGEATRMLQGQ